MIIKLNIWSLFLLFAVVAECSVHAYHSISDLVEMSEQIDTEESRDTQEEKEDAHKLLTNGLVGSFLSLSHFDRDVLFLHNANDEFTEVPQPPPEIK